MDFRLAWHELGFESTQTAVQTALMDGKAWLRLLPLVVTLGCDAGAVRADVRHRLNQTERRNTARDLLGTQLDPAANFPAADLRFCFENIAQVLSVSPLLLELCEQAVQNLVAEVMNTGIHDSIVVCDANPASWPSGDHPPF